MHNMFIHFRKKFYSIGISMCEFPPNIICDQYITNNSIIEIMFIFLFNMCHFNLPTNTEKYFLTCFKLTDNIFQCEQGINQFILGFQAYV